MVGRANAQTNVTTRPCNVATYTPLCRGPNGLGGAERGLSLARSCQPPQPSEARCLVPGLCLRVRAAVPQDLPTRAWGTPGDRTTRQLLCLDLPTLPSGAEVSIGGRLGLVLLAYDDHLGHRHPSGLGSSTSSSLRLRLAPSLVPVLAELMPLPSSSVVGRDTPKDTPARYCRAPLPKKPRALSAPFSV